MSVLSSIKMHFRTRAEPQQKVELLDNDPELVEKVCECVGLQDCLYGLMAQKFAINIAINLIAGLVSKCEFQTFINHKPAKGDEYYLWNIRPNVNQNSTQFLQELVHTLIYNNECLVFQYNYQLIIAESFNKNEYALLETTFDSVSRKGFVFNKTFKMSEVMYLKYNNDDIRRMFNNMYCGYDRLISTATERYFQGGGEKIIVKLPGVTKGTSSEEKKEYEEKLRELFEKRFTEFFKSRNAVLPISAGIEIDRQQSEQNKKAANEVTDVLNLVKDAFVRAGQALKIPAPLLNGEVADVEEVTNNLLTFAIDPLTDQIEEEVNGKKYGPDEFKKGNFIRINTSCIKHTDMFDIAQGAFNLRGVGFNFDEIREGIGLEPLNTDFSEQRVVSKNFATEDELKEGDE